MGQTKGLTAEKPVRQGRAPAATIHVPSHGGLALHSYEQAGNTAIARRLAIRRTSENGVPRKSEGADFERVVEPSELASSVRPQMTLDVSRPGDPGEEEADRTAERVMRMAEPPISTRIPISWDATDRQPGATCEAKSEEGKGERTIRRQCASCDGADTEEEEDEPTVRGGNVQRKEMTRGHSVDNSSSVTAVARSADQPLDAPTRGFMEPRFGADFGRVRIRADTAAAEAAHSVNAHAFTLGGNIVFGSGKYAPQTDAGRRLLAHELTHVLQQGDSSEQGLVQRIPASYDVAEQKKLIEEGIRDRDIGKIKDVESNAFALASDDQAIDLIMVVLNQGWVGPRDEKAIYDIWKSRGKYIVDVASRFTFVWNICLKRGVDTIWTIPDLQSVTSDFKKSVANRARGYLDANKTEVDAELKRYGLTTMGAAPTPEEGRERDKMMLAAGTVKKARDAIEQMDRMLVGYNHVLGTPTNSKLERCAALFNPGAPPPLPGHVPMPADLGALLPNWEDTRRNYERAHAVVDHYTRIYPALVALREDTDLATVARSAISSEEPAENLTAMQVVSDALNQTRGNIDKTYGLVNDPKGEFALELQPIHEQFFMFDPMWKDPFRQMIARAAVAEHGNVEFWATMGVSAVGLALFVVAELSTGGLATFFFAAAAAGGIAQAAASWDKYFTLKAAAGTNLSADTSLISQDQASDQLLAAAIDTVMAFVDVYTAAKGGAKAVAQATEAETKLGGLATKETEVVAGQSKAARGPTTELVVEQTATGETHVYQFFPDGSIRRCSGFCELIATSFRERSAKVRELLPSRDVNRLRAAAISEEALEVERSARVVAILPRQERAASETLLKQRLDRLERELAEIESHVQGGAELQQGAMVDLNDPALRAKDRAEQVLVNDSYIRNPKTYILDASYVRGPGGKIEINGVLANGEYMYVVDLENNIILGSRAGHMPHPTLIGGKNPRVQAAGMVDIRGGLIKEIDNVSGHYKPPGNTIAAAQRAFQNKLPAKSFHREFKGFVVFVPE